MKRLKSVTMPLGQILAWSLFWLAGVSMSALELNVIGWNLESGDIDVVANRIGSMQGIDIWGFSEVQSHTWIDPIEIAAEEGEDADYQSILGSTGGGDRLLIIYDADRFTLVSEEELDHINIGGNVRAPLVALF